MEKTSSDLVKLSDIPTEIQQEIAAYLDAPSLSFFAQSNRQTLNNVLPLIKKYHAKFPLQLTAGRDSTYIYQANQLFVCGKNIEGELGVGDERFIQSFAVVPWPEERGRIEQVIAGSFHTLVLTQDNRLWVCGHNGYGELGMEDWGNRLTFISVPWPAERSRIQQVIAGGAHTIVLTENNQLWVCGYNPYGQLGLGDGINRSTFTTVPWPEERGRILQVIAGIDHTIVLSENNRLWVCGRNEVGQLGLGDRQNRSTFIEVPWPAEQGKIEQVIAGSFHTLVLTQDNRLWVCGNNQAGQLGVGDNINRLTFTTVPWPEERGQIQQVITGVRRTYVLTDNKKLWGCGNNVAGQLGVGDKVNHSSFTVVQGLEEIGTIQQTIVKGYYNIIITNNRLWVCEYRDFGRLGLDDSENRFNFVPVNMKKLLPALQKVVMFNRTFHQLIKLGTTLMRTPGIELGIFHSKRSSDDEPEGQPPLKKMQL